MTRPLVEFGLCAYATALAARMDRLGALQVERLHAVAARCVPDDAFAQAMVAQFVRDVGGRRPDVIAAGEALAIDLDLWLAKLPPEDREHVIWEQSHDTAAQAGGGASGAPKSAPESEPVQTYDWQERADLK